MIWLCPPLLSFLTPPYELLLVFQFPNHLPVFRFIIWSFLALSSHSCWEGRQEEIGLGPLSGKRNKNSHPVVVLAWKMVTISGTWDRAGTRKGEGQEPRLGPG